MFPVLVTPNLASVKHFYEEKLGFSSVFYDENFYLHLLSPETNIELGFLIENHASQPSFLHTRMVSDGFILTFEVEDVEQSYVEAKVMGFEIALPLKEEVWGQKHFIAKDIAGFYLDFVEQDTVDNEVTS